MNDVKRALLSQGMTRPGVTQGQVWRETDYGPFYTSGLDGEPIPVYVLGGRTKIVHYPPPAEDAS